MVQPVSDRILMVRVQASPWNLTLIQVYAPINQATDQEKEAFFTRLEEVYDHCPKQDIVRAFQRQDRREVADRQVWTGHGEE